MTDIDAAGTFTLGDRTVRRMGYGAMQLAGPHVLGPPRDRAEAIAVLREAVESGVDHIDTADTYGPHVVNEVIREALHPYGAQLTLVTKVGAVRGEGGAWDRADAPEQLEAQVVDNLRTLGLDALEVVNLRVLLGGGGQGPTEGSIAAPFEALAALRERGLVRHLGVSNVTPAQVAEAQAIAPVVCVQNLYNLAHREDDALVDRLAGEGVAYVPFFPLGGFSPLQSRVLDEVAQSLGATPMQTALAWLLRRSPNILLIPGTSSRAHLRENLAAAALDLPAGAMARLEGVTGAGG